MSELTEFLLARFAEDEADARKAMGHSPGQWASWNHRAHTPGLRDLACGGERLAELPTDIDEHIARHDPARVLAECEAMRRIVGVIHEPWFGDNVDPEYVLRPLAAVYADHPDYREEWKP